MSSTAANRMLDCWPLPGVRKTQTNHAWKLKTRNSRNTYCYPSLPSTGKNIRLLIFKKKNLVVWTGVTFKLSGMFDFDIISYPLGITLIRNNMLIDIILNISNYLYNLLIHPLERP